MHAVRKNKVTETKGGFDLVGKEARRPAAELAHKTHSTLERRCLSPLHLRLKILIDYRIATFRCQHAHLPKRSREFA